jgi:hypothetical protein
MEVIDSAVSLIRRPAGKIGRVGRCADVIFDSVLRREDPLKLGSIQEVPISGIDASG